MWEYMWVHTPVTWVSDVWLSIQIVTKLRSPCSCWLSFCFWRPSWYLFLPSCPCFYSVFPGLCEFCGWLILFCEYTVYTVVPLVYILEVDFWLLFERGGPVRISQEGFLSFHMNPIKKLNLCPQTHSLLKMVTGFYTVPKWFLNRLKLATRATYSKRVK